MEFEAADDLLKPGYLDFESGYKEIADGKYLVAALTRMPGCRAKMVDWWFSYLGGSEQYKLWHPTDHVSSAWENRVDGKYIGSSHLVEEYLAGKDGPLFKLRISFHEPTKTFDEKLYAPSGAMAVCALIGEQDAPLYHGRMTHFVRNTDYGCEMRSRFWLGIFTGRTEKLDLSEAQMLEMRRSNLKPEFARRLHQHAVEEMGYLAEILPTMYRRMTLDNTF